MKERTSQAQLSHLYRRMGLSLVPPNQKSLKKSIAELFKGSEIYIPLDYEPVADKVDRKSMDKMVMQGDSVREDIRKRLMKEGRENIRNLNKTWVNKMATGDGILRERMSLFWHGQFACRVQNPKFVQSYIETIRKHSLGNFGEMLLAVSKEPAMLQFLNNQQNRKNSPNENFAREVMELFTLGIGNYSETDVKEGARAFTGWGFDPAGSFQFRTKIHDDGTKTFLGQKGNFQGKDVIRILLAKKETAHFVTSKIYKSFVSESADKKRINILADEFYKSGYDIGKLMQNILEADWFYNNAPENLLIKSPVELLVGIQRTLGATFTDNESILYVQKVLGQVLFYPPNVAGWPGGRNWIDSSSLLFRMQLPALMAGTDEIKVKAKDSGDVNDLKVNRGRKNAKATIDWNTWAASFEKEETGKLPQIIAGKLLAVDPSPGVMKILTDIKMEDNDRVDLIRKITLAVMSLPEYQIV